MCGRNILSRTAYTFAINKDLYDRTTGVFAATLSGTVNCRFRTYAPIYAAKRMGLSDPFAAFAAARPNFIRNCRIAERGTL